MLAITLACVDLTVLCRLTAASSSKQDIGRALSEP
jgi:hypothetical protein